VEGMMAQGISLNLFSSSSAKLSGSSSAKLSGSKVCISQELVLFFGSVFK